MECGLLILSVLCVIIAICIAPWWLSLSLLVIGIIYVFKADWP